MSEIGKLAQALVRIPSSNPPGNEDRIAHFAAEWLRERGLDPQLVPLEPGRSSVVVRVPGVAEGSIVLCGHLDTVRAEANAWRTPPFEGRIEGDRVWGLGATDMKGSVAVLMHVAARLVEEPLAPLHDVVLVLTADEERGYRGAATVAESGLIDDARVLLVAEPTAGAVYTGQKGELWVEVGFDGHEAHGSTPELGINAILPASRFCTRLHHEMSTEPDVPDRGRTTLNIGRFLGGRQVNIVPDRSSVQLDVRVVSSEDHDRVLACIDRIGSEAAEAFGARFKRRILSDHPPIVGEPGEPHAVRLQAAVARVTGRQPTGGISPFSTDAVSIVPKLDVPVLIYGPGDIARAHRPDESIGLDALAEAFEVVTQFVAAAPRAT